MQRVIHVGHASHYEFKHIHTALAFAETLPENINVIILIKHGVYPERIRINRPNITLRGCGDVEITGGAYALQKDSNGCEIRTFKTATCFVDADDVTFENITLRNHAGQGHVVGQAVALHLNGTHFIARNCMFKAYQDTVFLGPLPDTTFEGKPFLIDTMKSPGTPTESCFIGCYIEGTIDFIFGGGTAYFSQCQIHSLSQQRMCEVDGYITAASTAKDQKYGFVFDHCTLSSDPSLNVYLGRPWRPYGHTVFQNCLMGSHINEKGWQMWSNKENRNTTRYGEFENQSQSSKRVAWAQTSNQAIRVDDMFANPMIQKLKEFL